MKPATTRREHYDRTKALRKALRKPACERCGGSQRLGTHHLDGNPANNEAANLMTLCPPCHTTWHWQHGKPRRIPKPCSVCGNPSRRAGMCQKHFQRLRLYGDPLLTKRHVGLPYCLVRVSPHA